MSIKEKMKPKTLSMLAFDFKFNHAVYKRHDGRVFTKIGEGSDIVSGNDIVYLIDENDDLFSFPADAFDKKVMKLSKGLVRRFEKLSS